MTVKRILQHKGVDAPFVHPRAKIFEVIELLELEDVGALVVSPDGQIIDGIVSERDIVRGLQEYGSELLDHRVSELMSADVVTCTGDDSVAEVMAIMDDRNIRHVPVVENGKLAGIVSIRDIVRLRLDEVGNDANAMRAYIANA